MAHDVDPLLAAFGDDSGSLKLLDAGEYMNALNSQCLTGAQDGGSVVGVVRRVQQYGHRRQAALQDLEQPCAAGVTHHRVESLDQPAVGPAQAVGTGVGWVGYGLEGVFTVSAHVQILSGGRAVRPHVRERTSTTTAHHGASTTPEKALVAAARPGPLTGWGLRRRI